VKKIKLKYEDYENPVDPLFVFIVIVIVSFLIISSIIEYVLLYFINNFY
jgi:hypothetical protein